VILTSVGLTDVRNYPSLDFSPSPGLNVFLGNNAQGKSNLLEAIAMLGTGKSFRTSREVELIRTGRASAKIIGEARMTAGGVTRLACTITGSGQGARKSYTINGEGVRYTSFLGRARIVTFTPQDLQLIDGAPSHRRALVNVALAQENPRYYHALSEYGRTLAQKNALLRGAFALDETLLNTYDERLIAYGTLLMLERERYIREVADSARSAAAAWVEAGTEGELSLSYQPNVVFEQASEEGIREAFARRLRLHERNERARGQALVGPHRDDVLFTLGGRSLAAFGSQGQRRTAVLALKVAEYAVMRERSGEAPLLLLDDVLSELDARRQAGFLEGLGIVEQAFITSAGAMPTTEIAAAYHINGATLTRLR
jgi:DNA replication and repair protein RecF